LLVAATKKREDKKLREKKEAEKYSDIQQGGDTPHVYRYDKIIVLRRSGFE